MTDNKGATDRDWVVMEREWDGDSRRVKRRGGWLGSNGNVKWLGGWVRELRDRFGDLGRREVAWIGGWVRVEIPIGDLGILIFTMKGFWNIMGLVSSTDNFKWDFSGTCLYYRRGPVIFKKKKKKITTTDITCQCKIWNLSVEQTSYKKGLSI